jgi:hypothetical protein
MKTSKINENSQFDKELEMAVQKVLDNPASVFETSHELKSMGFHAAASALKKVGYSHTKASGLIDYKSAPPAGAVVVGKGPMRLWFHPTSLFEKDVRAVAERLIG